MNDIFVAEIEAINAKRIEGYDKLITLAEEQQQILLSCKRGDLSENLAKFDPILVELKQLARKEEAFVQRLREQSSEISRETITARFKDAVMARVHRLRDLTEKNVHLLNNLMSLSNFTMELIGRMAGTRENQGATSNQPILLDLKV